MCLLFCGYYNNTSFHRGCLYFCAEFDICSFIVKKKKGFCEVIPAPFAVFLNANDKIYVEPDISVICDKSKINEKGCVGAPNFIIEIVSPGSRRIDYHIKLFKYRTAGVKEYWIVDPIKNLITVYNFQEENTEIYNITDKIKVGIYEDLEIDFSELEIE